MPSNEFDRGDVVLFQAEDGKTRLEVQLDRETVWLNQAQMVTLFERDVSVVSRHIRNVFAEGELTEKSNLQKMQIANSDRPVVFYSLDVIISVGYRVKSQRGTQFRQWATRILRDHIVKGSLISEQISREWLVLVINSPVGREYGIDQHDAVETFPDASSSGL